MTLKEIDLAYAKQHYPIGTVVGMTQVHSNSKETRTIGDQNFKWMGDGRVLVGTVEQGNADYSMALKTDTGWAKIISMKDDKPFTIGGYVRAIVDGDIDRSHQHNRFKKGEIYQIKTIDLDGLINYDQPGPRLYMRKQCNYPIECEWIGMNPLELLPQEESLVEVINNFPIY